MDEPRHGLARGYTIEGYRIERVLGAGGFGITYLATEIAIDRPVAIKEYLPNGIAARSRDDVSVQPLTSADRENFQWGLERFKREAQTLVAFQHPNIVTVYRFFEANGTAYLVMGYEDGDSLASILDKKKTLDEASIRAILEPLLSGLEQVHNRGFLHRDIKPGNIYLRKNGSPVLLDFGAARLAVGARSQSLTSIVSAGYAPFEQYTTRGNQGPWTDIYALGGVLYRAVTGQRPPDAPDRIRNDPCVPAAKAAAKGKYSAGLLAAIDAALIVDETQRPQSLAQWRPVFDGAPWPPGEGEAQAPSGRGDATIRTPQATLVVGAESGSRRQMSQRDVATGERDHTRWPTGTRATGQPTQPPVAGGAGRPPKSGGASKWLIIGALAVTVLAAGGVAAVFVIPGGNGPGPNTVIQQAEARVRELLAETSAAIARRDKAAAERAIAAAEALVREHKLSAFDDELRRLRQQVAGLDSTTPPPPPRQTTGSWPSDPEFRKAVDDTIRRLVPEGR